MSVIEILIVNIIPLYCLIGLGYIAGRWLDVNIHSIAQTLIFLIAPIVTFGAMTRLKFEIRAMSRCRCWSCRSRFSRRWFFTIWRGGGGATARRT